ncbi:hypothetical protein [Nakamurella antarctica]|nr:hypothetical protein [Nakamurella antarctica]
MTIILFSFLAVMAVAAPRFGVDSRRRGEWRMVREDDFHWHSA